MARQSQALALYVLTVSSLQSIEEHYFVEEFCGIAPRVFSTASAARAAVRKAMKAEKHDELPEEATRWKVSKGKAGGEFCDHTWGDPHDSGFGTRRRLFVAMP